MSSSELFRAAFVRFLVVLFANATLWAVAAIVLQAGVLSLSLILSCKPNILKFKLCSCSGMTIQLGTVEQYFVDIHFMFLVLLAALLYRIGTAGSQYGS